MRRSRANPFKSTQLRQWGFICYLGGHIVSRRERTDRLRRASDGAGPREPAPTENAAPTTLPPSHPLSVSLLLPSYPLLFYGRHPTLSLFRCRRRCHPPEKRIRRYTSASKFPSDCPYFSPLFCPPLLPFSPAHFSRFLSLLEIFDGKIWPFVCAFVSLASQAGAGGAGGEFNNPDV